MANEPVDSPEIRTITLRKGLEVKALKPTEAQAAVALKSALAAQRDPQKHGTRALEVVFRIIEILLVDAEKDGRVIDDGLIDGSIQFEDLLKIFRLEDEDAAKTPAPRTRRRSTR